MGEVVVHALNGVDLNIHSGEFIVLLGPSGSGKSTLLNILGGLDTPSSGEIYFNGKNLTGAEEDELTGFRRDSVGFVFQFYNLIPSLTARENIQLVSELSQDSLSPEETLTMVDLVDRGDHFPGQLSGGEQQRVAIARAISKNPKILLCDEPTGALDFKTGRLVLEAISDVNRKLRTTTIVITHNANIGLIADRIIEMRDGKILSDRTNSEKMDVGSLNW
ncbi:MAG: ABC transporter ATP-binding protein [Leptospiraceae bacterium]|nr:ABC transporter ATP-binding protein [Leptospiraceae bacterium]MCP5512206.1 ABC transporter ATP-binding protein [Leptospiraceae bacterium]